MNDERIVPRSRARSWRNDPAAKLDRPPSKKPPTATPRRSDDDTVAAALRADAAAGPAGAQPPPTGPTPRVPRDPPSAGRNLPMAIATGIALASLLIGSLFHHPLSFTAVIALFVVLATVESGSVLRRVGVPMAVPAVLAGGLVIVFGTYRSVHAGQAVGVLVLFLGSVVWLLADPDRTDVLRTIAVSVFFGLWTAGLASFGVLLVTTVEEGSVAALLVIGGAIFGDIGGYAVGSMVGRTKVAPSVSPNKTVEGLVGGLVVAAGVAALVIPRLSEVYDVRTATVVAALCALAGFFGDLLESMVKRDVGVKDLGAIIPGHGGIMDRVDGILVALPIGFYTLVMLH